MIKKKVNLSTGMIKINKIHKKTILNKTHLTLLLAVVITLLLMLELRLTHCLVDADDIFSKDRFFRLIELPPPKLQLAIVSLLFS